MGCYCVITWFVWGCKLYVAQPWIRDRLSIIFLKCKKINNKLGKIVQNVDQKHWFLFCFAWHQNPFFFFIYLESIFPQNKPITWYSMFFLYIYILNNNTNNVSVMVIMSVMLHSPMTCRNIYICYTFLFNLEITAFQKDQRGKKTFTTRAKSIISKREALNTWSTGKDNVHFRN